MPELPEVEVVRRGLQRWITGRSVAAVEVLHPRAVRRHVAGADDFAARLIGRTIVSVERRGKFLWWVLDDEHAVVAHLGMSGQLLVVPSSQMDEAHLRVRVRLAEGERESHGAEGERGARRRAEGEPKANWSCGSSTNGPSAASPSSR